MNKRNSVLAGAVLSLAFLGGCKTLLYTAPEQPTLSGSANHGWLTQKADAGYFMIEASVKEARECSFQGSKLFPEQTDIMIAVTPSNVGTFRSDQAIPVYHKRVYGDGGCRIHRSDVLLLPFEPLRSGTSGTLKLEVIARNTKDENVSQYLFSAATFAVAALPVAGIAAPAILASVTQSENAGAVAKFNEEYKKYRDAKVTTDFPVNIGSSDLEAGKTSFSIPIYALDTGAGNMESAIADAKANPNTSDRRVAFTVSFTISYRKSVFAPNADIVNEGSYYKPDVKSLNHRDVLRYTGSTPNSPTLFQRLNRDLPAALLDLKSQDSGVVGKACESVQRTIEGFGLSKDDEAIVYHALLTEVAGEWNLDTRFTNNPACFTEASDNKLDMGTRLARLYGTTHFVGTPPKPLNIEAVVNPERNWLTQIGHTLMPRLNRALQTGNRTAETAKVALATLTNPTTFSTYIDSTSTTYQGEQALTALAGIKLIAVGCNIRIPTTDGVYEAVLGLTENPNPAESQKRIPLLMLFQLDNPDISRPAESRSIVKAMVLPVSDWKHNFPDHRWRAESVCRKEIIPAL
ncbi:hypothetical protein [Ferrovibrio terrae]|uniref:hypothetical protein n=1 Tax=Ferrovibrio terrae TaxID=2594003 RepID=UPI003137AF76